MGLKDAIDKNKQEEKNDFESTTRQSRAKVTDEEQVVKEANKAREMIEEFDQAPKEFAENGVVDYAQVSDYQTEYTFEAETGSRSKTKVEQRREKALEQLEQKLKKKTQQGGIGDTIDNYDSSILDLIQANKQELIENGFSALKVDESDKPDMIIRYDDNIEEEPSLTMARYDEEYDEVRQEVIDDLFDLAHKEKYDAQEISDLADRVRNGKAMVDTVLSDQQQEALEEMRENHGSTLSAVISNEGIYQQFKKANQSERKNAA